MVLEDMGINWSTYYRVIYMDDRDMVLESLGAFHRWDASRMFRGIVDGHVRVFQNGYCLHNERSRKCIVHQPKEG